MGCEIKGKSIYGIHKNFQYDYCILQTNDNYEFAELLLKTYEHTKPDGRIIIVAPLNWHKTKHPDANIVKDLAAIGKTEEMRISDEQVLLMFDKKLLMLDTNQKTNMNAETIVSEQSH